MWKKLRISTEWGFLVWKARKNCGFNGTKHHFPPICADESPSTTRLLTITLTTPYIPPPNKVIWFDQTFQRNTNLLSLVFNQFYWYSVSHYLSAYIFIANASEVCSSINIFQLKHVGGETGELEKTKYHREELALFSLVLLKSVDYKKVCTRSFENRKVSVNKNENVYIYLSKYAQNIHLEYTNETTTPDCLIQNLGVFKKLKFWIQGREIVISLRCSKLIFFE